MEILKHNEQSADVILTPEDVESAIRQFICTCNPDFAINWIINPKYNLGAAVFAATKSEGTTLFDNNHYYDEFGMPIIGKKSE